ncbi:MAG: DNA repair protein RecN, partial [Elusimicrobiota bacterium]|nr:DNA repair protein RecN [Elusimicrobiota bacterium]
MILSLSIKNYALIEDLNLNFNEGFTAITGETGAGKSILLEALELVCGKRADTSAIRTGCLTCSISASFIYKDEQISNFLSKFSIDADDNTILIRRTIENSDGIGRSKAFINDCQVNISTLAALGNMLMDFHAQDEKYTLNAPSAQIAILDSQIPQAPQLLSQISKLYFDLSALKQELDDLNLSEAQKAQKIDLYSFQLNEINDAQLTTGEDERLEIELPKLKNAEKISALSNEIIALLYSNENSALSLISKITKNLQNLTELGIDTAEILKLAGDSYYQLEEVYHSVDDTLSKTDISPEKLNQALARHDLIKKLKKKYGQTIDEILAYGLKVGVELETLENLGANANKLELEIEAKEKEILQLCDILSQKRKAISADFSKRIKEQLGELEIANAVFEVDISSKDISANGKDKVEFMFSANAGQQVSPLRHCASGGEMSRVMLAIELSAKFNADQTAIFDEIDTGTGGRAGDKIGKKLAELSRQKQVFSVTHLAQSVAFCDTHIKIFKEIVDGRAISYAKVLTPQESVAEIARMISGQEISDSALSHA